MAAEGAEGATEGHKKVVEVLHLSCVAVEMTSRLGLGNLLRAACIQAWNCCCKFNLFDQVDSLPEELKDDLLVICNRLMDFVFEYVITISLSLSVTIASLETPNIREIE